MIWSSSPAVNLLGTLELIEASIAAGVKRFIFVSTCAVHEKILDDRPLDEAHPLWPLTHYGAHKAAIEKFVHSYGYGQGLPDLFDPTLRNLWCHESGQQLKMVFAGREDHRR